MTTNMDDYIAIIKAKTAALFAASTQIAPVIARSSQEAQSAAHDYGLNLGIAFQIADDALDYVADQDKLGKTIGDDFREGKLTAPILIALQDANAEEQAFWKRTLSLNEQTGDDLNIALDILSRHNAIKRSLTLAESYGEKAIAAINTAPDHPVKSHLIDLVNYAIHRET
jgi:octaprenyl-diphosphate synthase